MKATIVELNAEIAKRYLSQNKKNRSMSNKSEVYAQDMINGRWKENGESIIIDSNGLIKDGQHRLSATIKANHKWKVPVITEVDTDVMDTIDTGKNRSLSDILKLENIIRPTLSSSLCRAIIRWDWGWTTNKGSGTSKSSSKKVVTNYIGLNYVLDNKMMMKELTGISEKIYQMQTINVFSPSDIGLFIYIITKGKNVNNNNIINFIKLITGIEMDNNTSATWYYKKMLKYKQGKERISRRWKIAVFIKCWNLYVDGNPPVSSIMFDMKSPLPKVSEMKFDFVDQ